MQTLPKQKSGILRRKIGNEAMLYDTNQETVHILNLTAEIVWDCCDGTTRLDEVERKLKSTYKLSFDHDVKKDLEKIITDFSNLGLLHNENKCTL